MRTSNSAQASAGTTLDRVPPPITPALTVIPRARLVKPLARSICRPSSSTALCPVAEIHSAMGGDARAPAGDSWPHLFAPSYRPREALRRFQNKHRCAFLASDSVSARECSLPVSSSLLSKSITGRVKLPCFHQDAKRADGHDHTGLHVQDAWTPGPALAHPERHCFSVPNGQTVSRWPSSINGLAVRPPETADQQVPSRPLFASPALAPARPDPPLQQADAAIYAVRSSVGDSRRTSSAIISSICGRRLATAGRSRSFMASYFLPPNSTYTDVCTSYAPISLWRFRHTETFFNLCSLWFCNSFATRNTDSWN